MDRRTGWLTWNTLLKQTKWRPRNQSTVYLTIILILSHFQGIMTMDDLTLLLFGMLMKFTYGRDITEEELQELNELRALVGTLIADTFTNPFVKFPFYKNFPTTTNKRMAEFERRWLQFNKR